MNLVDWQLSERACVVYVVDSGSALAARLYVARLSHHDRGHWVWIGQRWQRYSVVSAATQRDAVNQLHTLRQLVVSASVRVSHRCK